MLSLQKKKTFLSFHSSIFHSKKFISILHIKLTGMNKDEQVENLKFWVNILSEWPQSLFAATKVYILIFNLTHSFISLMGSFHFLQWKIFLPIHWQSLNILGNGISRSFILSLKCDHPLLCEFSILFWTVKLKLDINFLNSSIDSTLGFWNVGLGLCVFSSFSQFIKGMRNWDYWKA